MFASTVHWKRYDPFFRQKNDAFKTSKTGILELAERFREFAVGRRELFASEDSAQQKLLFVRHLPQKFPVRANLNSHAGGNGAYLFVGQCL